MILAFECYADQDLYFVLKNGCKLNLQDAHKGGQGRVVKEVFVERKAHVGIVDEDPGKTHHAARDQAVIAPISHDLELHTLGKQHPIVVKPRLEECFLRTLKSFSLLSSLPDAPDDLHRILMVPNRHRHETFRKELESLYQASKQRNAPSFITEIEETLRHLGA